MYIYTHEFFVSGFQTVTTMNVSSWQIISQIIICLTPPNFSLYSDSNVIKRNLAKQKLKFCNSGK